MNASNKRGHKRHRFLFVFALPRVEMWDLLFASIFRTDIPEANLALKMASCSPSEQAPAAAPSGCDFTCQTAKEGSSWGSEACAERSGRREARAIACRRKAETRETFFPHSLVLSTSRPSARGVSALPPANCRALSGNAGSGSVLQIVR